jgi:hypothetical protein
MARVLPGKHAHHLSTMDNPFIAVPLLERLGSEYPAPKVDKEALRWAVYLSCIFIPHTHLLLLFLETSELQ